MTTPPLERFILWRQDDNGQKFRVGSFERQTDAELRLSELQAGGHRQIYWIETGAASDLPPVTNLLRNIPEQLPEELFEPLLERRRFRLERIVSRQHATPSDLWYDQPDDEWVLLVSGSAGLQFAEPQRVVNLTPGDYLLIPAHSRHRVAWTDPGQETIWLALHFEPEAP